MLCYAMQPPSCSTTTTAGLPGGDMIYHWGCAQKPEMGRCQEQLNGVTSLRVSADWKEERADSPTAAVLIFPSRLLPYPLFLLGPSAAATAQARARGQGGRKRVPFASASTFTWKQKQQQQQQLALEPVCKLGSLRKPACKTM